MSEDKKENNLTGKVPLSFTSNLTSLSEKRSKYDEFSFIALTKNVEYVNKINTVKSNIKYPGALIIKEGETVLNPLGEYVF